MKIRRTAVAALLIVAVVTNGEKTNAASEVTTACCDSVASRSIVLSDTVQTTDGQSLAEKWGVEVENLSPSAGGYMLDFRYRVLDAEKSKPLFNKKTVAYLLDNATGAKLLVPDPPKVGQLRSGRNVMPGKTYFVIFANPKQRLKPGMKATVVIGDFKQEMVVQ